MVHGPQAGPCPEAGNRGGGGPGGADQVHAKQNDRHVQPQLDLVPCDLPDLLNDTCQLAVYLLDNDSNLFASHMGKFLP